MVICTSDSGRKLYEIEEYPDYEYIAGYYAWDGVIAAPYPDFQQR